MRPKSVGAEQGGRRVRTLDGDGAELGGGEGRERPQEGADGRAGDADDADISSLEALVVITSSSSSRARRRHGRSIDGLILTRNPEEAKTPHWLTAAGDERTSARVRARARRGSTVRRFYARAAAGEGGPATCSSGGGGGDGGGEDWDLGETGTARFSTGSTTPRHAAVRWQTRQNGMERNGRTRPSAAVTMSMRLFILLFFGGKRS